MSCCRPKFIGVYDLIGNPVPVPCGHCLSCRIDKQIVWKNRLTSEFVRNSSAFVTLTYDDYHLPVNQGYTLPSLSRDDLHKYHDRLRHNLKRLPSSSRSGSDFKYFAVGEYGDRFGRPHYHALYFGLDFAECRKVLMNNWKNGSVKVLPVQNGAIRYVLKYLEKSQNREFVQKEYLDYGLEPPFIMSSHGIGLDYFYSQLDNIKSTGFIIEGQRRIPVPAYYKNMLLDYNMTTVENVKNNAYLNYTQTLSEMTFLGFTDYSKYLNYKRVAKEKNLLAKARFNLTPAKDYLND